MKEHRSKMEEDGRRWKNKFSWKNSTSRVLSL